MVTEVSNSEECCTLIENTLDNLSKEVKVRLLNAQVTPATSNILPNDSLVAARLKKKEVNKEGKNSKRRKSWTERQYKAKRIGPATTTAPLSKVYATDTISFKCNLLQYYYLNFHIVAGEKAEKEGA